MMKYMEKYRSRIVLMWLFVFIIHGAKLNSNIVGIDTEDLIRYQSDFYDGWLDTGRQGLVLIKQLLGNLSYNPYFSGLLTVLCFAGAVTAFYMMWDAVGENRKHSTAAWIAGGLLLISHPIITEQFYFTLQSAEIGIGLILTVVALYLTYCWDKMLAGRGAISRSGRIWLPIISIVLLLLTFSIYQVFVVIYIFGAVTLILLQGLSDILGQAECKACKLMLRIVPYIIVFLIAFVLNSIITGLFFQTSEYLSNQIQWGKSNVMENFRYIGGHVVKTMTGYEGIYYNWGYGILCVVTVGLIIILVVRTKQRKSVVLAMLFLVAALLSTPYLMTIVLGAMPAYRSQLVLPLATGFLAYLAIELWRNLQEVQKKQGGKSANVKIIGGSNRILIGFVLIGCVVGIWQQTKTTLLLYYTDSMRYEQDEAVGRDLIMRIEQLCEEEEVALVVVGSRPFEGNNICLEGEMTGVSFFDHDADVEPPCYWSTRRAIGFLHVLGADYDIAPENRFDSAIDFSEDMPAWPAEDCVQMFEGVTIVKLSDY